VIKIVEFLVHNKKL